MGIFITPIFWLPPALIAGTLAIVCAALFSRLPRNVLLLISLLSLALFALPFPVSSERLDTAPAIGSFFTSLLALPALAWFSAAMLLASNLQSAQNSGTAPVDVAAVQLKPDRTASWYPAISLALCAMLLAVSLRHLYWIFAWDATTDAIGVILWIPVMWIAVGAALLLVLLLWWRRRWAGVVASALFLAAVIVVTRSAMRIDFRQATEKRAGQVTKALERRFSALGSYPQTLEQLEPWYLGQYLSQ